jgi:hypothetical protein
VRDRRWRDIRWRDRRCRDRGGETEGERWRAGKRGGETDGKRHGNSVSAEFRKHPYLGAGDRGRERGGKD